MTQVRPVWIILGILAVAGLSAVLLLRTFGNAGVIPVCDAAANSSEDPVYAGEDGWLFTKEDFRVDLGMREARPYLEELPQILDEQGIEVVVAVLPTRAMVADRALRDLPPDYDNAAARMAYRELVSTLEGFGFRTVDLLPALDAVSEEPEAVPFFRRDHHWTPLGARASARRVAEALRSTSAYSSLPQEEYETFMVAEEVNSSSRADVLEEACGTETPPEVFTRETTSKAEGGLLSSSPAGVVLVGTSHSFRFAENLDYNFDGYLMHASGVDVLNFAVAGGGPYDSFTTYLASEAYRENPAEVIVWEFPAGQIWNLREASKARKLVAAARGSCSSERMIAEWHSDITGAEPADFGREGGIEAAERSYVHLEFSPPDVNNATVTVMAAGSESAEVQLERHPQAPNSGHYFAEVTQEDQVIQQLSVEVGHEFEGEVDVTLCRPGQ